MGCCAVILLGHLILSSYFYFNQDESITKIYPVARWLPIISVMLVYAGHALGFGSIAYILQVRQSFEAEMIDVIDGKHHVLLTFWSGCECEIKVKST